MIREMQKQELSVWQIAKQQGVSQRHARRLRARFQKPADFSIQRCGRKPQPLTIQEEQAVLNAHAEFGFGALSLENVLKTRQPVSHNKIHAVLLKHGLAVADRKKQKKRKWVRWERRHSNSLWHADWQHFHGKELLVLIDDASRLIVGYGLFTSQTAENSLQVFAVAAARWGVPRQLLTDNGSHFCNTHDKKDLEHVFHGGVTRAGCEHIFTRPAHPQCDGKLEKLNDTIQKLYRHFGGDLGAAVAAYNERRLHMSLEWQTPLEVWNQKLAKGLKYEKAYQNLERN